MEPEGRTLFAGVSVLILAMGIIQVWTLSNWSDLVYTYQSIIILATFALILRALGQRALRRLPPEGDDLQPSDAEADLVAVSG